ncbi:hypothetical protein ACFQ1E_15490 [Sphingomonas canadensis]|uniref:DUF560 domain-containing protein n=1 Tax=Sphingomonas canadensis TaxID=1219257 RepID=A0ABW3HDL2_9SPHN|nr:hypothetical protein [Sphingomonas canadensis]MCW3837394.1 hypothetical protein [Sphingomonas canadensis]
MRMRLLGPGVAALAMAASLAAAPAAAQESPEAEIDALIDASATPEAALATARGQAAAGALTDAAATVERALLAGNSDSELSLFYVALLCRLDDRPRAAVELARAGAPANAEVQAACGTIAPAALAQGEGESESGWHGQAALGFAWDRNAAGALRVTLDIPGLVPPSESGYAVAGSLNLDGRSAIDGDSFFYGRAAGYFHNDLIGPRYDYQQAGFAGGFGQKLGKVELSGGALLRYSRVYNDRYLTEFGGEARAVIATGADSRITLRGEIADQDYLTLPLLDRDGMHYDISADFQRGGAGRISYVVGGGYDSKSAKTDYLGYDAVRGYAAVRFPLAMDGAYLGLGAAVRHIDYYNDPMTRDYKETRYNARVALGLPVAQRLTLEPSANYTRRDYNPASLVADYESFGAEIRLILKFGKE